MISQKHIDYAAKHNRKITRLVGGSPTNKRYTFECEHGHQYEQHWNNFRYRENGHACRVCAQERREATYEASANERGFDYLGRVEGTQQAKLKCKDCGETKTTMTSNLLRANVTCTGCVTNRNNQEASCVYLMKLKRGTFEAVKVGSTRLLSYRISDIASKNCCSVEIIKTVFYENRMTAYNAEREIINKYAHLKIPKEELFNAGFLHGATEMFKIELLNET